MLTTGKLVGFLLTKEYEPARGFYEGKLGFAFVSQDQFALVMRAGENMIRMVKMPDFRPLKSTVLGREVGEVGAVVTWLAGRGVETEVSVGAGPGSRDLDDARRGQGGVVQRSGWKCVVGKPAREVRSEPFAKQDAASGDSEAAGLVDALGKGIGDVGVGGHFRAALCARPIFGGVKKRGADALAATRFRDEPTFHVAYR